MEPVVNGNVVVPTSNQQLKQNLKTKIAFKQDIPMTPTIQQDQFSSMPMVYEPDTEPKKKSSSSNLILGTIALLTTGLALWKYKKAGSLQEENATLKKTCEELTTKVTDAENKLKNVEEVFNDMDPGARIGGKRVGKSIWARLKAALTGTTDDKKVADKAKDAAEKVAGEGAAAGEKLTGEEAKVSAAQAAMRAG